MDGTLLEAWASVKSFQPKDGKQPPPDDPGNPDGELSRGEAIEPDARSRRPIPMRKLARKGPGKEAKLSYSGNLLVENRNGLIVDARGVRGQRNGGARCGAGDAGTDSGNEGGDGGRRQRI